MYQGGSLVKKGPMIAIREQDIELPRDAEVRACEWPSEVGSLQLNKIDSNYSYKCLEPISCIRITWDLINLSCKLKNMVTYAAKIYNE